MIKFEAELINGKIPYLKKASLIDYNSFKIDAKAEFLVLPRNEEELKITMVAIHKLKVKHYVLGGGTNILFCGDFNGVVVCLKDLKGFSLNGEELTAYAGERLPSLAGVALKNSLSGLEELSQIPGTLGGAIRMNAGAFGREVASLVQSVTVLSEDGEMTEIDNKNCFFGYRESIFSYLNLTIISAKLKLKVSTRQQISAKMEEVKEARKSQPTGFSAGSVFKKTSKGPAGMLIDACGLKGLKSGDAIVSDKHANFIINLGRAKSKDICKLIEKIKRKVYNKFDITLEEEIVKVR